MRRRDLLTGSAAFAAMTLTGNDVGAQAPVASIFGILFRGALEGAGSYLEEKLMERLMASWTGQPPGRAQLPPPPSGWPAARVPPPNRFLNETLWITRWLSELTKQIFAQNRPVCAVLYKEEGRDVLPSVGP
jgi:hypothetical protein